MDGDDDPDEHTDDATPTDFRTLVVKTGLSGFCRHPALLQQIEAAVQNATVIQGNRVDKETGQRATIPPPPLLTPHWLP